MAVWIRVSVSVPPVQMQTRALKPDARMTQTIFIGGSYAL